VTFINFKPSEGDIIVNLYYLRHFSELNETAKGKKAKELPLPVTALLLVTGTLLASPFILVGGLIYVSVSDVIAKVNDMFGKDKSYDEIDDKEFIETVREVEELQHKFAQLQKSSKYQNLIYRYHKIDTFIDPNSDRNVNINIQDWFKRGKVVMPALVVIYYCHDGVAEYKNFLKTFPNQDIPYYEKENEDYLDKCVDDIRDEAYEHIDKVGGIVTGKYSHSYHIDKYPHCVVFCNDDSGNGTWITIKRKGKAMVKRKPNS